LVLEVDGFPEFDGAADGVCAKEIVGGACFGDDGTDGGKGEFGSRADSGPHAFCAACVPDLQPLKDRGASDTSRGEGGAGTRL